MGKGQWYRYSAKPTEQQFRIFRIADLKNANIIGPNRHGYGTSHWDIAGKVVSSVGFEIEIADSQGLLKVAYTNLQTGKEYSYAITITTTEPYYGGHRYWFVCPGLGCGRRTSVLYLGEWLRCRKCHGFAYHSQRQSPMFRQLDRAQTLHKKLGGSGIVYEPLSKPKGMHWQTFKYNETKMRNVYNQSQLMLPSTFRIML